MNRRIVVILRVRMPDGRYSCTVKTGSGPAALFQTLHDASFTMIGAASANDPALVSAGRDLVRQRRFILGGFDGEFARHASTYAGTTLDRRKTKVR